MTGRIVLGIAVALVATSPSLAQRPSGGFSTGSPRNPIYLLGTGGVYQLPVNLKENRSCLVRKSTGKVECRTRSEWSALAARIGRGERDR